MTTAAPGDATKKYVHKGVASDGDLARHTAVPDLGALLLALGEVSAAARVLQPAVSDFQNEVPLMRIPISGGARPVAARLRVTKPAPGPSSETARGAAGQMEQCPVRQRRSTTISDYLALRQGRAQRGGGSRSTSALAASHREGLVPGVIDALEDLAGIATLRQSAAEAARLFGAAATTRVSIGLARRAVDESRYQQHCDRARRQLTDKACAAMWVEGGS